MACFLLVVNNLTIILHVLLFSTELEIPQDSLKFHLKAATLWEFKVNSCSAFGVIPTFSFQSPQTKSVLAKSHWTSWGARCPFTPLSYAWAVWVKVAKPLLAPTSKHISTFLVFIGHFCCRNVQVNILFFVKITWWFESLPCEIMNEGILALFFALEAQFNWCGGVWSCSLTKDTVYSATWWVLYIWSFTVRNCELKKKTEENFTHESHLVTDYLITSVYCFSWWPSYILLTPYKMLTL